MFSHINGKLLPRPFELYGWTWAYLEKLRNTRILFPHPKQFFFVVFIGLALCIFASINLILLN